MSAHLLKIQQAKVIFKGQEAFASLEFEWEKGQHWAIVGESGWQMTAFLETLRGNALITSGKVSRHFADEYIESKMKAGEVAGFRDLMAYVSQNYQFKNKSNLQNFYFQQRFNSAESEETDSVEKYLSELESKTQGTWTVEKVIILLRLGHLRKESLLKLSNGETRRLALAAGLLRQPKIFLMDQPMTGLDAESRATFGEILKELIEEGIHIVLTASANEIPYGITHIAEINSKGIRKLGKRDYFPLSEFSERKLEWDLSLLKTLILPQENSQDQLIRMDNVTIKYDGKAILENINWQVNSGERWHLKGENGSGKSTLISLLIGENPQAYAQDIWIFGKKRGTGESIWDVKKPIGFVAPELARFFPSNQTCRKVILSGLFDTMGLFKKPTQEQNELADQWIKLFKLEEVAGMRLAALSLEQQRWTLFARALIKNPKLLILDEASQGMDSSQRKLFRDTVDEIIKNSSLTLIYTSHYKEDIPTCVNQVFELRGT